MDNKTTCGPLFLRCLEEFADNQECELRAFSAGHMVGQAEKIYLGACSAAMFRPSPSYREWAVIAAIKISAIYGLQVSVFEREEIKDEIWIHKKTLNWEISLLNGLDVNSPEWHSLRGRLCGIPEYDLDPNFHLREGYNLPCDKVD